MKLSLITSTFNSAATLQDTFDSVRQQTISELEYIVIDGGSTDQTLAIIEKNKDIIHRWISEPDKGIYDALNKGIKLVTGDVVGFIHSDDILANPDALKNIVAGFESSNTDAVYGDLQYVEKANTAKVIRNWKSKPFDPRSFYHGWMPAHPTFYLKRECYLKYGLYDTSFRISADYELMLRMVLKHKLKAVYMPELIVKMRVGGESNVTLANRWKANKEDARAWKLNGLKPRFYTRWMKPISKITQFLG